MARPLLDVKDLTVRYGQATALSNIDLTVAAGERVILLGRNGAGKTTLLKAISGLVAIESGAVHLNGQDLGGRAVHAIAALGVAHVSEGRKVFPTMTVRDNLHAGGSWVARERRAELSTQVLDMFPRLSERSSQVAGTLSGGERQMLLIARALMLDPILLLLDEASQGLAPVVVDEVLAAVARIGELGVTTLIVEQNTRVLDLDGRVLILNNGQLSPGGHSRDHGVLERVKAAYLDEAVKAEDTGLL